MAREGSRSTPKNIAVAREGDRPPPTREQEEEQGRGENRGEERERGRTGERREKDKKFEIFLEFMSKNIIKGKMVNCN